MSAADEDLSEEIDIPPEVTEVSYTEAADFSPGGMIGRYQLCVELASGGMAKVYLARVAGEAGFEKLVALKRIHPHFGSEPEFIEMFMDEARIASRIDHPNVCSVFDFGRAGREHFIAMEYLLGETLGRVNRRANDDLHASAHWWQMAMRIVSEAAEGLHAAHELRDASGKLLEVVHRDVTPANLFVTYDGSVKVVDFGVARAQDRVHKTREGRVKGQYAYMAPEQAKGKPLDRRADIWSLGVILWELLAGKRLFERDYEATTLMAVVAGEVPPLADIRPGLPVELTTLVGNMLSVDPAQRPATARAVARELDRYIARLGDPVGKGDLGDLMEHLFPTELARRKQMISDARRMEAGRVVRVDEAGTVEESGTRDAPPGGSRDGGPTIDRPIATDALLSGPRSANALDASPRRAAFFAIPIAIALVVLLIWVVVPGEGEVSGATEASVGSSPVGSVPVGAGPVGAGPVGSVVADSVGVGSGSLEVGAGSTPPVGGTTGAVVEAVGPESEPEGEPAEAALDDESVVDGETVDGETVDGETGRGRPLRRRPASSIVRPPGTVSVVTPGGWADVYLGGRRVGRAPGRIEVPSGHQTLELRPFGRGPPRRVSVDVPPGGSARVALPVSE